MDCIFCKIIAGTIPSIKIIENDHVIAIDDINPAAPVHVLVIPKTHIENIQMLKDEELNLTGPIHRAIQEAARIKGIADDGYRVISNCGRNGGQTVPHLHYHVIGGVQLKEQLL